MLVLAVLVPDMFPFIAEATLGQFQIQLDTNLPRHLLWQTAWHIHLEEAPRVSDEAPKERHP